MNAQPDRKCSEMPDFLVTENGQAAAVRSVKMADPKQRHLVSLLVGNLLRRTGPSGMGRCIRIGERGG
jgi:hypothetical protein